MLESFGWPAQSVVDLGGIETARGAEMYLVLWISMMQAGGTPDFNVNVVGCGCRADDLSARHAQRRGGRQDHAQAGADAGARLGLARPPYSSAMCFTIARPRPVPGPERASSMR